MKRSTIIRIALFLSIITLLGSAIAISRDFQDSWILEGLEIHFLLFITIYVVAFFSEKKLSRLVILATIGRTVLLLIPNLKYIWFQGTAVDQTRQYALTGYVLNQGHISSEPKLLYGATPLMHLSFSIFSLVLDTSIVNSMKFLPVFFSMIYPFLIYVIVNNMHFSQGKTILKYALFISSIPFTMEQYVVTGSLFGIVLTFLFLTGLILMLNKGDIRYWLICIIFIFAVVTSHSVTSILLSIFLLVIMVLQRFSVFRPKSSLQPLFVFSVISISITWLMFHASNILEIISMELFFNVPAGTTPVSEYVAPSFFEHLRVNAFSALKSFSVIYGADALLLLLTLFGLIILLKRRKKLNSVTNFLLLFGWVSFLFILIGFLAKLGGPRSLNLERLFFPVFASVFIIYVSKKIQLRKWILPIIFSAIILLASIELYNCQPLVPPANVLYKDLPPNVPMGYVGQVNSIYQRQMIIFVERHLDGKIACPSITRSQIIGYTDTSFWTENLISYYPLDKAQRNKPYDYFLVHLPGKSGIISELPISRNPSLILEAIYNSSIVYNNGESYVLINDIT